MQGDGPSDEESRPRHAVSPLPSTGIRDIIATLDQLELQIAEYRKVLVQEESSSMGSARYGATAVGPPSVVQVDEQELGSVAEEIAAEAATLFDDQVDIEYLPKIGAPAPDAAVGDLADTAVAVAQPIVDSEQVEDEVLDAPEPLKTPDVDLPNLFAELRSQLEMGLHETASVSIYVDGKELLAYLSAKTGSGVTPEPQPLFRAFSSGKAMAAATVWRLLDDGVLEIDAPVARYWPEFAQRGKSNVTVRHVLTHTAGLPRDYGRGDVDWGDWGRMSDILASMPLDYEPGEVIHYHSITFGILVAEIVSRATGLRFVNLFEREVATPLNLSDTRFVVDYGDLKTRARVLGLKVPDGYGDPEMPAKMDWLLDNQVISPGASCITTARDLAKLYSTLCNDGVSPEGESWLSAAATAEVFATHASAYDIESMEKSRVGQGVWMFDDQPNRTAAAEGSVTFGHGGMGSSIAWGDPDHNVGVAIITDTMQDDEFNGRRLNRISAAIRRDLDLPIGSVSEL